MYILEIKEIGFFWYEYVNECSYIVNFVYLYLIYN